MTSPASARPVPAKGAVEGRSLWKDARIRFFRNKAAVASLFVFLLVCLFAFFGQFLS